MNHREMNHLTGNYGESLVQLFFTMLGYKAEKADNGCGDLKITCDSKALCIEVKTAHKGNDSKWRFTLESKGRLGITLNVNYVILVALIGAESVFYVIPASIVRGKRHIVITSNPKTYTGFYANYRYAWEYIIKDMK